MGWGYCAVMVRVMERLLSMAAQIGLFTERQLRAIENGKHGTLVKRLCATIREAWFREACANRAESERAASEGRIPVLGVLYPSGVVDVYGPREEVSVRVVCYPNIKNDTPEIADLCERLVEIRAGKRHRELLLPEHLRATGIPDKSTIDELIEVQQRVQWLKELKEITNA